jgi:hypothetical protein
LGGIIAVANSGAILSIQSLTMITSAHAGQCVLSGSECHSADKNLNQGATGGFANGPQGNQPLQVMNVRPFLQFIAIWWLGFFAKDPDQNPMPPDVPKMERPVPGQRPKGAGSDDPNQQLMIPFLPIAPGTYTPGVTSPFWLPEGAIA